MEQQEKEIVVSLPMLWEVFRRCFWFLLATVLFVGGAVVIFSYARYTPVYTAKTDIFIINEDYQASADLPSYGINTYNLALYVVKDCKEIMEGRGVREEVREKLGISEAEMKSVEIKVTENSEADSRILNVSVTAPDPALAYRVSEGLMEVSKSKIDDFCSHDVKTVNPAVLPTAPSNSKISPIALVIVVLAAALVYVVFLLFYLFDDRVRTAEDVEELGLSLLGDIPNSDDPTRGNKYGGYYGKKYGAYYMEYTAKANEGAENE